MLHLDAIAQLTTVSYSDKEEMLEGQLLQPAKNASGAGILILPAWMGIDEHSKAVAQRLADLGYTTFIADIYGKGKKPQSRKEAGERSSYYKSNIGIYQRRIRLALEQLVKAGANPDRIVVAGYCFGGLGAIEAARTNMPVKGIVSFHGSYGRDSLRKIEPIRPSVLILHGADDPYNGAAETGNMQEEFRKAGADWQMISYGNAVHAFTEPAAGNDNSKGAAYNALADKRSWDAFLAFLKAVL